jgi:hypothetical protein
MAMESEIPSNMPDVMDVYLYKYAKSKGKKTTGLETMDEQQAVFDLFTIEQVVEAIEDYEKGEDVSYEDYIRVYQSSNLEKLQELNKMEEAKNEKFMKALLQDRNKVMSDRMPKFMKEASTLFAVGAGHLAGEEGLLTMLEGKGFTVSPIVAGKTLPDDALEVESEKPDEVEELMGKKFDIQFPTEYEYSTKDVQGMKMHIYTCTYSSDESANFMYNLIYYKLPMDVSTLGKEGEKAFFEAFEDGIVGSLNGKVVSKKKLKLEKGIGSDMEMSLAGDHRMGVRVLLQDDFCVILQVMSQGKLDKREVEAFYNSLKLK